jgi:hypothetical protein
MNLRISVGADENCVKDESRNTGDADLKLLLLANGSAARCCPELTPPWSAGHERLGTQVRGDPR